MDAIDLFSVLALGFLLGMKHALEPDHLIAVSTIVCRSKKWWKSSLAGVFWGIGHTSMLLLVGLALMLLKTEMAEKWSLSFECLVGLVIIYFGASAFLSAKRLHEAGHVHPHASEKLSYFKTLLIGLIHGLAGSGAMVLLTMSTVDGLWQGMLYILFFGAGTVLGMLCFTTLIGIPFTFSSGRLSLNKRLVQATGVISVLFGLHYIYKLMVTDGLLELWSR
ncbi:hydantoin utilization protein A [Weizmannia acidilactici]|uniref:Hydantoin utilization protein A n=1 Tax=Weizmannia acidilactici TaxID=2607726 RepID=A0A5J4JGB9_9BACI|nr:sulfite exporter TauE/SafE family protein [Weizmannia acidilactici]GER67930.1 hydantoin utilization protein A [Weizmannia acidilactici]GER71123.1 hydantoin utilization protein A [Weizmannia acidilactici]GER73833.1 hydantoin utilization protein A [Weizmannia acidilactici]